MRYQWASAEIQKKWGPKVATLQQFVRDLEIYTVLHGSRAGAIISRSAGDSDWDRVHRLIQGSNLRLMPFDTFAVESFSSATRRPGAHDQVGIKAFLSDPAIALPKTDQDWGRVLGYPSCCTHAFISRWQEYKDHTLDWSMHGPVESTLYHVILKLLGLRLVFHLPCNAACEATKKIANRHAIVAAKLGFQKEVVQLIEILKQPMHVSSQSGIGEVLHPFFRIIYESDVSRDWSIDVGTNPPTQPRLESVRPANGFDLVWKDNGFAELFAMERAHADIVNEINGLTAKTILDLGAGNGLILARLKRIVGANLAEGVECDRDKVERGRVMFGKDIVLHHETIQSFIEQADVGRELVMTTWERIEEGVSLQQICNITRKYLVIYSYDKDVPLVREWESFRQMGQHNRRVLVYERV